MEDFEVGIRNFTDLINRNPRAAAKLEELGYVYENGEWVLNGNPSNIHKPLTLSPYEKVPFTGADLGIEDEEPNLKQAMFDFKGCYMDLSKMSEWQKNYCDQALPRLDENTFFWVGGFVEFSCKRFVGVNNRVVYSNHLKEIYFNDIFEEA